MPLFNSSTPFDQDIEKATSELNTTEDWGLILDICDKVQRTPNGSKDCLKSVMKRVNHKIPQVAMQGVTVLDALVNNCGHPFHLEVASRDFVSDVRNLINGKAHIKVGQKLKECIKKWAEGDFKSDSSLSLIPNLYQSMKDDGHDFLSQDPVVRSQALPKDPNVVSSAQEEVDIAKAIQLSLEENEKGSKTQTGSSSMYPSFSMSATYASPKKERRQVRALYDFEAAEDNELTFKAGEIIGIIDDSDVNWWKGISSRGEGLFPSNFVTADLSAEPEGSGKESKTVTFNEEVEVKTVEDIPEVTEVNEDLIDKVLDMLQNADPTGETNPDPPELGTLEEQAKLMTPLIDQELEKIDKKHATLMEINSKVVDALQMYTSLMRELPSYGYAGLPKPPLSYVPPQQQAYSLPPQFVPNQLPPGAMTMPVGVPMGMPPPTSQMPPPHQNTMSQAQMMQGQAVSSMPAQFMPPAPPISMPMSQPPPPPALL